MGAPKYLEDKTKFIGEKFGHWTVVGIVDKSRVMVQCDCGSQAKPILLTLLRCGRSTRCDQCVGENYITHGQSKTKLYKVWRGMKNRCNLPSTKSYKNYGAKGIYVCQEWDSSFQPFYEWAMANGYTKGLEIDRINNNDGYYPQNCRWVTKEVNSYNKSKNVMVSIDGVEYNTSEIEEKYAVSPRLVRERIRYGWDASDVVLPLLSKGNGKYKPIYIQINQVEYTIDQIAEKTGLNRSTVANRYNRNKNVDDIFSPIQCVILPMT